MWKVLVALPLPNGQPDPEQKTKLWLRLDGTIKTPEEYKRATEPYGYRVIDAVLENAVPPVKPGPLPINDVAISPYMVAVGIGVLYFLFKK